MLIHYHCGYGNSLHCNVLPISMLLITLCITMTYQQYPHCQQVIPTNEHNLCVSSQPIEPTHSPVTGARPHQRDAIALTDGADTNTSLDTLTTTDDPNIDHHSCGPLPCACGRYDRPTLPIQRTRPPTQAGYRTMPLR